MKTEFQGQVVRLETGSVTLPNGHQHPVEVVHHPGGAAVVAIDNDRRVCMLRQYRFILDDWIWELPAGKRDHDEAPLETAKRELREETGLLARHWQPLGESVSSPGVFTERIWYYLVTDFEQLEPAQEHGECLEIHWLALDDLIQRCQQGEIEDAKTIIGLMRASAWLDQSAL